MSDEGDGNMNITEQQKYSRQTVLPEIGGEGQEKLKKSSVAIVGVGALGTQSAELLTRAGVGKLILIDSDVVEHCNLQRQTLFTEEDIGRSKVRVAKERLQKINSFVSIDVFEEFVSKEVLHNADIILDCTDNFEARFIINEFCLNQNIPWIYAACVKTSGYVLPILPGGPCLGCFLGNAQGESACVEGILNTIPPIISGKQATLALQMLLGKEITQTLWYVDVWKGITKNICVTKNESCEFC